MGMYDQYETEPGLEVDGVWLDYDGFRILAAHAGGANKAYLQLLDRMTKPYRRAMQTGNMPEARAANILREVYAKTIVRDWQVLVDDKWKTGIEGPDGSVQKVTPTNITAAFENLPALFLDVQTAVQDIAIYRKAELEEDAKN